MIATIWEVWNDRHGDFNKSADLSIRICLLLFESLFINLAFGTSFWSALLAFNVSLSIFFLFFDYLVTYVLIRNKVIEPRIGGSYSWFTVTGKKGWFDNLKLWKFASPWVRFGIKVACFIISLVLFVML